MTTNAMEKTKALMGALVRMKPKMHEAMKVGASKRSKTKKIARSKKR